MAGDSLVVAPAEWDEVISGWSDESNFVLFWIGIPLYAILPS
jgi:hypothetical protein